MRRATARGRMVPQSLSTDPRIGQLSLKAALLYDRLWINADDQGRLSGNANEIKYATCPNVDQITKPDIPGLLKELETQDLIKVYTTSKTKAVQMLDWWEEQRLQWAYPSRYPSPPGWQDRLRYHPTPTEIFTENWPASKTPKDDLPPASKKLPSKLPSKLPKELPSRHRGKKSKPRQGPLPSPEIKEEKEEEEEEGRLPSALGSRSPPSPSDFCTDRNKISSELVDNFRHWFGRVEARNPQKVIPREPTGKELAQLRDLADELVAGGGCPLGLIREAFRDASGQAEKSKHSASYARSILLAWLGRPKNRSP